MEKRSWANRRCMCHPITFGGNVFGWTADEAMSFALLDASSRPASISSTTADVYSRWHPGNRGGESETIIGNWLKARGGRDKVIIATKLGIEMAPGKKGLSREHICGRRSRIRCGGCKRITSICTSRTATIRTPRSRRRCPPTPT